MLYLVRWSACFGLMAFGTFKCLGRKVHVSVEGLVVGDIR
jgi:hypothetical protein